MSEFDDTEMIRASALAVQETRDILVRLRILAGFSRAQCAASRASMDECLRLAALLGPK